MLLTYCVLSVFRSYEVSHAIKAGEGGALALPVMSIEFFLREYVIAILTDV